MHYYKKQNLPVFIAIKSAPYWAMRVAVFDSVKSATISLEKAVCEVWAIGAEPITQEEFSKAFQTYLNTCDHECI